MLKTVDQLIQMIRATRATQGRAPANKAQRKPVAQR